jgi:uncharacterized protein (DUF1499 family)
MRLNQTPGIARWTIRVALFSVLLVAVALIAHRFGPMPTVTAFNLMLLAFAGAVVTLVLGCAAGLMIWREGCAGALRVSLGMILALALLGWPLAFLPTYRALPAINDVSTDMTAPPKFVELVKLRAGAANASAYPLTFAKLQADAYPDLKPMFIDRPVEETFEIVREALFRQKIAIVREQAPENTPGKPGLIEAVDRTAILGLYDDLVLRVDGDNVRSRIDLRSASRFGRHDLGRNAERMRRVMREIVARLEATIPSATGESYVKWRKRGQQRLLTKRVRDAAAVVNSGKGKPAEEGKPARVKEATPGGKRVRSQE